MDTILTQKKGGLMMR
jgi:hypothetical protein